MTKPKPKPKSALDIFKILRIIDNGDINAFKNLSEEEFKAFNPYIVLKWLYGTNDPELSKALTTIVNPFILDLAGEKELLFNLMVIACSLCRNRKTGKFNWIKGGTRDKLANIKVLIGEYMNQSPRHSDPSVYDKDDIILMLDDMGYQTSEPFYKKIHNELKHL
jgi:hypothetical protein